MQHVASLNYFLKTRESLKIELMRVNFYCTSQLFEFMQTLSVLFKLLPRINEILYPSRRNSLKQFTFIFFLSCFLGTKSSFGRKLSNSLVKNVSYKQKLARELTMHRLNCLPCSKAEEKKKCNYESAAFRKLNIFTFTACILTHLTR